jgi:hypothetical protein
MAGWDNFFVAEVGASAALAGLIFVGVSINLAKILAYATLPERALEALLALFAVLFVSSLMLIPGQSLALVGIELLGLGLLAWILVLRLQINNIRRVKAEFRRSFLPVMIVGQTATFSFIITGFLTLIWGSNGLYFVVPATLLCFCFAFIDAWVLLIEINR